MALKFAKNSKLQALVILVLACAWSFHIVAQTSNSSGAWTDCTDVNIDYTDDPTLTEAEKLARV